MTDHFFMHLIRLLISFVLLTFCSIVALPSLAGGTISNATLPATKPGTVKLFVNRIGSGKAMDVRNDDDAADSNRRLSVSRRRW